MQSPFITGSSATLPRVAAALALTLACVQPAPAQTADVGETIVAAATALGMVRGIGRRMDSINTVEFSGLGTMYEPAAGGDWTTYEITQATVGMSYSIPAMRWDMIREGPDGSEARTVSVVRSERAWDERLPGVDPTEVSGQSRSRLNQIWLTPHGVMTAAVHNPEAVTLGSRDGQTTLTVPIDGAPVTVTLDDNARPATVEMTVDDPVLGETLLEAEYSDYIDWAILDVYFPSRIVQRLGGETSLELTVTEFFQNPYVVFPTPEQLSRSSQ